MIFDGFLRSFLKNIMPSTELSPQKNRKWHIILLFIFLGAIAICYVERELVYRQLDEWKLIPRPERFTELYLENHSAIPQTVVPGQTVPFSFTVRNLEGEAMEYPYEIYALAENDTERRIVARGNLWLEHDGVKVVESAYSFPIDQKRVTVFVELTDLHQQIHFILSIV
jgi:hypothetical protein